MDRTLILVKPDAFARNLTGEIIARFERKGLRIVALKQMVVTEELATQHYAEHDGKPFFGELVEFITSGPIVALKHMTVDEDLATRHYAEHDGKPFYGELVEFITSGPLVAMVLEGDQAVVAARQVIGATNPVEASPGSIRGDFAIAVGHNMEHGSDSPESAEREAGLFFPELARASHA